MRPRNSLRARWLTAWAAARPWPTALRRAPPCSWLPRFLSVCRASSPRAWRSAWANPPCLLVARGCAQTASRPRGAQRIGGSLAPRHLPAALAGGGPRRRVLCSREPVADAAADYASPDATGALQYRGTYYAAVSTSTISASSKALTCRIFSLAMAAPSRACNVTPFTSIEPRAGTR